MYNHVINKYKNENTMPSTLKNKKQNISPVVESLIGVSKNKYDLNFAPNTDFQLLITCNDHCFYRIYFNSKIYKEKNFLLSIKSYFQFRKTDNILFSLKQGDEEIYPSRHSNLKGITIGKKINFGSNVIYPQKKVAAG